jgi:Ca2+-binding EF-hand superfamily protein
MKALQYLLPCALVASCASTSTPDPKHRFNQADGNGDGVVDRQEATDIIIADAFTIYDANGDGLVDEAEFVDSGGDAAKFRKAVKPGSGGLTLQEAQGNPEIVEHFAVSFDEADVNKNGAITYQEYLDYLKRLEAAVR